MSGHGVPGPAPGPPPGARPAVPSGGTVRRAWHRRVGGLPRSFWWLWLGTLVNRAGGFVQPFLVLYLTGPRGLSAGEAGAVLAAYGAGALVSQPLGGVLTDRVGRRATIVAGLAATGVLLGLLGFARGLGPILLATLALGTASDVHRPAVTAAVADLLPVAARPRAFALQFWAINLGFSVAAVAGGVLAGHGYGLLFAVDAATCLLFAALVARRVPETRPTGTAAAAGAPGPPGRPGSSGRFTGLRAITRDRLLLGLIGVTFLYAVIYVQAYSVIPLRTRDIGLPAAAYGAAVAANGIAIVVVQPLLLPVFDRVRRAVILPVSVLLVGGGMALTGAATGLPTLTATVLVWTMGEIGFTASVQAVVMTIAPEGLRGRYGGATGIAWGGSALVGPLAGTAVYARHPALLWWSCLGLGVVAAVAYSALARAVDRRAATMSDPGGRLAP